MRLNPLLLCAAVGLMACGAMGADSKMRSIDGVPDRHVTIARSDTDYISFPDVCLTHSGRLICVYRVADKHVATRARMEVRTSDDGGKTWSEPDVLADNRGHCARLAVMPDGEVLLITDSSPVGGAVYRSTDNGETWSAPTPTGLRHGIPDRPLRIGDKSLLTTGHRHVGKARNPLLGQAPSAQILYRSDDMGKTWYEWAPLAFDVGMVLCEASMFAMPDGSLRAYLRENCFVQEPTYVMSSFNEGASWTYPQASPTIGHRPCAGLLRSGRALVTYRHVGPNGGNRAWLGDVDRDRFFAPSAFDLGNGAELSEKALTIDNKSGDADAVMYSLRPITDPRTATAELEIDVAVMRNEGAHCGIHLGCQWHIFPDRVEAAVRDFEPIRLDATGAHRYTFTYSKGDIGLKVDGKTVAGFSLADKGLAMDVNRRPIRVGNVPQGGRWSQAKFDKNGGQSLWRTIDLRIDEPRYGDYEWSWRPADGLPNQYEADHILELDNDRHSSPGDFGYSGWVQLGSGDVFCVSHYKGDAPHSYVKGYWIKESDFE